MARMQQRRVLLVLLGSALLLWLGTALLRGSTLPSVVDDTALPSGSRLAHLLGAHDSSAQQQHVRPPTELHDAADVGDSSTHSSSHSRLRAEWVRQQLQQARSQGGTRMLFPPATAPGDTRPRVSKDPFAGVKAQAALAEVERREREQQGHGAAGVAAAAATASAAPIPVLLFTYNRAGNLRATIDSILERRPANPALHPLFISQDGSDEATRLVAREFVDNVSGDPRRANIHYMTFRWEEQRVEVEQQHRQWVTYYKIATHYKWALGQVFDAMAAGSSVVDPPLPGGPQRFEHVIMLEDDMRLSVDFFPFFRRTQPILDADNTLMCVSAWNDNGRPPLANDPRQLYRTDCFPGLGWMMSRRLWEELGPRWPKGFWDDWLREPSQRRGRSCIYPAVNRVHTFGDKGASAGQFFEQFLRDIRLNDVDVDWNKEEIGYVTSQQKYTQFLIERIAQAQRIQSVQELPAEAAVPDAGSSDSTGPLSEHVLVYSSLAQLDALLASQNMMTDHKAGVPRTSVAQGVITFTTPARQRVWLVPHDSPLLRT